MGNKMDQDNDSDDDMLDEEGRRQKGMRLIQEAYDAQAKFEKLKAQMAQRGYGRKPSIDIQECSSDDSDNDQSPKYPKFPMISAEKNKKNAKINTDSEEDIPGFPSMNKIIKENDDVLRRLASK